MPLTQVILITEGDQTLNTEGDQRGEPLGGGGAGQREVGEGAHLDGAPPTAAASPSPPGAPGSALLVLLMLLVRRSSCSSCSWYDAPRAPGSAARVRAPVASPPGLAPPAGGQRRLGSSCWLARSSSKGDGEGGGQRKV
jgi:hypothetical protein